MPLRATLDPVRSSTGEKRANGPEGRGPRSTNDNRRSRTVPGTIANSPSHVAIRDSKTPARATLIFPTGAFSAFLDALKSAHSTVTDFARFRG
ncbi:DUF397 domain-containing protein [Streptomyces sp. NPDC058256]|uniref:DUF397 domain-containing protein n=1 Tax=Streptomyces sp. NPDC058256 TaxID=3346408 RepID=UPI0036E1ED35